MDATKFLNIMISAVAGMFAISDISIILRIGDGPDILKLIMAGMAIGALVGFVHNNFKLTQVVFAITIAIFFLLFLLI